MHGVDGTVPSWENPPWWCSPRTAGIPYTIRAIARGAQPRPPVRRVAQGADRRDNASSPAPRRTGVNDDSENGGSRPRWAPIVRPALQDEVVSRIRQMI